MSSVISLKNVTKSYVRGKQKVEVLHQLDLEIPEGEFLALMGPSGSGKTTLLNLIGGLDQPTGGEIVIAGQRIDTLSSAGLAKWRARHVGFIFQFYNLMPTLSAERNVELPLLLTSLSSVQRKQHVAAVLVHQLRDAGAFGRVELFPLRVDFLQRDFRAGFLADELDLLLQLRGHA